MAIKTLAMPGRLKATTVTVSPLSFMSPLAALLLALKLLIPALLFF